GMVTGLERTQMLCLRTEGELALVAGSSAIPLAEVIEYSPGRYSIDRNMIWQLVDASSTADARYTPSTARREVRKLETEAMYEDWRKAYRKLKKANPKKSDAWCSSRIARMDIARHRDPETIRRKMKM
ncbi:MAG: hypothetical protein U9Q81_24715, partial [Pseudomonadota bacterium]|nr:hypothetical protein [Pseudomonadota bacterium]